MATIVKLRKLLSLYKFKNLSQNRVIFMATGNLFLLTNSSKVHNIVKYLTREDSVLRSEVWEQTFYGDSLPLRYKDTEKKTREH